MVVVNDSVTREAITRKQERAFLEFVKQEKHFSKYYEGIYILFKTGLRISEFVGLTISDIDLEKGVINVNHQLQRKRNMEYIIEDANFARPVWTFRLNRCEHIVPPVSLLRTSV